MKKISFITALLLIGFFVIDNVYVREGYVETETANYANTFEEVEMISNLIIKAKVLPNKKNKLIKRDGHEIFGYTETKLEVLDVFKGDVEVGDTVVITEGYYYSKSPLIGKEIIRSKSYVPASKNKEYIFFLTKYSDNNKTFSGMYYPADDDKGKYPILKDNSGNILLKSSNDLDYDILEIKEPSHDQSGVGLEEFKKYYDKVQEKYMN